uniref:CAF17 C-terminal domain-containing protein n=1 Tax=Graphocephala atropunctata TaxID=36148 RepID=A0A1B6L8G9_9HEMI
MILCLVKPNCARALQKTAFTKVSNTAQRRLLNISCQVEQLKTRGLVRVSGDDVGSFLQGIVTNDMRHLEDNCKSLFSMFLNTKGRVLYDSIIYNTNYQNTYFVECDSEGLSDLVRHLKMYRVRRKIDIDSIDNEFKVWALFNPISIEIPSNNFKSSKQEQVVPCTMPNFEDKAGLTFLNDLVLGDSASVYADPRLSSLGSRVIARDSENIVDAVQRAGIKVETSSPCSYRMFRYRLGVGEGIQELPMGKCFPLEANCDYLHGVSFHKGCYIGQELTARTHHTGVVRKRLMPLLLESELSSGDFSVDMAVEAATGDKKTPIGKLRGVEKNCALGLMRIVEALEVSKLRVKNIEGETVRPFWWPQELPKERMDTGRT